MLTIQKRSLYDSIVDGIKRAKELAEPILISSSTPVQNVDPLLFFMAGKAHYAGERSYWKEPLNGETIVGIGALTTIESEEKSHFRYKDIEGKWTSLLQSAIHLTSAENEKSHGPILFGGFSFDPKKDKTSLWTDFPEAKFYIPKFTITTHRKDTFLTTNLFVTQFDHADQIVRELESEEELLYAELKKLKRDTVSNPSFIEHEINVEEWLNSVETVVSHIKQGKLEKAVLARELKLVAEENFNVHTVLLNLERKQPTSYIFAIESGCSTFIGATPERLVKKSQQQLLSTCLAGSIKRGMTEEEDMQLANNLLEDPKNLAEHQFVVDMITKELEEVCLSISKPREPVIFKARDIQHLYTPIVGVVKENVNLLSIVERLHPTPALGGFPQDKALEEIRHYEQLDRGWYAAPIGWLDGKGDGEFAVAIRSGLFKKNEASLFAGCGIVAGSEASKEYEETRIKLKPMLNAIGGKMNER